LVSGRCSNIFFAATFRLALGDHVTLYKLIMGLSSGIKELKLQEIEPSTIDKFKNTFHSTSTHT
jgi:hypothetical protein